MCTIYGPDIFLNSYTVVVVVVFQAALFSMQDLRSLTRDRTQGPSIGTEASLPPDVPGQVWFSMTVPAILLCISSGFSLVCYVPPLFFPSGFSSASCQSKPSSPLHLRLSPQPWKNLKDYVAVFSFKIWSDYSVSEYNEFQPLKRMK